MFTSDPFVHFLDDPWADHPVRNRKTICYGGGGDDGPPQAPDYSQYITAMSNIANQGQTWAREMMAEAKTRGVDLIDTAKRISGKSEAAGDTQQASAEEGRDYWKGLSRPLYDKQQQEALRMNQDLPQFEEHEAGRGGANAAIAIDQQMAALQRKMMGDNTLASSGIAKQALGTQAAIGRSQATTAAAENQRLAARLEARKALADSLKSEEFLANEASDQAKLAQANRGAATDAVNKSAVAASSLYAPAHAMYGTSADVQKEWGNATAKGYDQTLAAYKEDEGGGSEAGDIMGLVGGIGGTVAGAYFGGPAGAMAGGSLGSSLGKSAGNAVAAQGGKIPPMGRRVPRRYAQGGAIDTSLPGAGNLVTPEMSPSGGEEVDDVPAVVSEGEFVIPERTVDWFGEQYFQKLIMKSDKEREQQTVAAPDIVPDDDSQGPAVDTSAPQFRSEGARV